jgi:RNA polymerase sigma-70 factor (ECF subfamily)
MTELTRSFSSSETLTESDQLVLRLKEGDEQAFAEAFQLHKDFVYTLAFKLLNDKAEAMDVTQEVFATLFRKVRAFRGDSSLKTWLYRVAINQAANRNRWWNRRFRHRTLSLDLASQTILARCPAFHSRYPSPAGECYSRELRHALQKSLQKLPFDQRVAVTLRDVEGLTYEEIAELTSANIGTVKSRIARGREKLRTLLRPCWEGSGE